MAQTTVDPARLACGFDFARRQRDPAFRAHLRESGWVDGMHVVAANPDDTITYVFDLIARNGTPTPCLVAVPDGRERFGFRLAVLDVPSGPAVVFP